MTEWVQTRLEADQFSSDVQIADGTDAGIIFFQVKASRSRLDSPGKAWAATAREI